MGEREREGVGWVGGRERERERERERWGRGQRGNSEHSLFVETVLSHILNLHHHHHR